MGEKNKNMKTRVEHISFESFGEYMDVQLHIEPLSVDITIGGTENSPFNVTLDEWKEINRKVLAMLKQK
jgi:hypothetical protein